SDEDSLWVGTFDHGVSELQDGVVVSNYSAPELTDDRVMSLLLDRQRRLWIGTMAGGLNRLDPASGNIVQYRHDPENPQSLGSDGVMSLHEDQAGVVWVGTYGGGVYRYDPQVDGFSRFEHDPEKPNSLTSPRATAIVDDLDGYVWIGTDDGLNRLDPATGSVIQMRHDPEDSTSLGANKVYALHIDNSGTLWVGTAGGGLSRLIKSESPLLYQFENYSQTEGLPSNVVYGIHSDAQGRLWLSTNNGVARRDTSTGVIKTFHKAHGLQGDEFNFGAHHQNSQGVLFFGGANGFNAISPAEAEEISKPPQLVLTKIEVLNRPAITAGPHSQAQVIKLGHKDKLLTFEFAALDYTSPAQNKYRYLLEGFDPTWTAADPSRRATYTNLDPGTYTFGVKASNSDGVWNEEGIAVSVKVAPAPWQTWWAYAIYTLAAIIFLAMLARLQWRKQLREKQYQEQLHKLAYFDTLTGVPNRHLFIKHLTDAISQAKLKNQKIALLYLDLDQFKRINDTLGHSAGDAILKLVTKRLIDVTCEVSSYAELDLSRIGGDEFVITIAKFGSEARIVHLAERILESLSKPFQYQRYELAVTPSIGVSVYPQDGSDVSSLLKNADTAMYDAKNSGRNDYRMYSPIMNEKALDNLDLEEDLRRALEEDQLYIVYQPKVDLRTMKVTSAEALLRWKHPERGDISPARFIPIAEQSGLILDVDRWVTTTVCNQLSDWQRSGVEIVPVAVNLSGSEFTRGGKLVAMLMNAVGQADIDPRYLQLEITEGVLMNDADAARTLLARLKVIGFHVAVDDFGTGYSSLSYLKGFSLSALKIDQSFVLDVESNSADQAICAAIISMAHGLGLRVIAEGVETQAQFDFLKQQGCDVAQGHLVGKPALAHLFPSLLLNRGGANLVLAGTG
ncbi:MAG: EAL domain-containing protein, partial [Gammaproteobacteria bacterium]|nr:EAL domain-containing protein [Gammaproteobacteria bacterium]